MDHVEGWWCKRGQLPLCRHLMPFSPAWGCWHDGPMGAGTALRLGRTALFAVVCVAVSGLGHALMSGAPLPLLVQGAALIPVCGPGGGSGRGGGTPGDRIGACARPVGLHAFFSFAGPRLPGGHGGRGAGGGRHAMGAMNHSAHQAAVGGPFDLMGLLSAFDGAAFTLGMAAAHALAGWSVAGGCGAARSPSPGWPAVWCCSSGPRSGRPGACGSRHRPPRPGPPAGGPVPGAAAGGGTRSPCTPSPGAGHRSPSASADHPRSPAAMRRRLHGCARAHP